jgi:hypothetical protein
VREAGARFVVVSTPMPDPPHGPFVESMRRLGVTHLDLSESFRGQSDYHFPHDVHWNAKGSAIVADAVEAFLEAQGVFEPRPRQAAQRAPAP